VRAGSAPATSSYVPVSLSGSGRKRIGWSTPCCLMLAASSASLTSSKKCRGLVLASRIFANGQSFIRWGESEKRNGLLHAMIHHVSLLVGSYLIRRARGFALPNSPDRPDHFGTVQAGLLTILQIANPLRQWYAFGLPYEIAIGSAKTIAPCHIPTERAIFRLCNRRPRH
jgi:hypothetical protein